MPPNPPSKAHGFAMRSMSLRDMQIPKSEKKFLAPPPDKSWERPCYYTVSKTTIVHVYSSTLTIYETAMPYMSLSFFRLISSLDLSAEKGQRIAIC